MQLSTFLFILMSAAAVKVTMYYGMREEYTKYCDDDFPISAINLKHLKFIMQQRSVEQVLIGPNHLAVLPSANQVVRIEPVYENRPNYPIICADDLKMTRRDSGQGVHIQLISDPKKDLELDAALDIPRKFKKPVKRGSNSQNLHLRFAAPTDAKPDYNDLAQKLYQCMEHAGAYHAHHLLIPVDVLISLYSVPLKVSAQVVVYTVKRWIQNNPHTSLRILTYSLSSTATQYKDIHLAMSDAIAYHYGATGDTP